MPSNDPSGSSAVIVAVRCRPMNEEEKKETDRKCLISMSGATTTISDPTGKIRPLNFSFDYSFWSGETSDSHFMGQEGIFSALGTLILDSTFKGYNGCLFAYGQTGSGKTYSMMGYGPDKGIIPRLCESLFERAMEKKSSSKDLWELHVEVSYLEIYNEKCRCLLTPVNATKRNVEYKVREHPVTGPYVENLSKVIVHGFDEIDKLMAAGNMSRTVAATCMNTTSSRSHAIFSLTVTQTTTHVDQNNAQSEIVSKINLVDLAGSERANRTGATGSTLKEGSNINKSLTTLGKVINGLAEGSKDGSKKHIPFRDSVLTWLLKENLCGNSKTIMLAALSPAASSYDETVSTLRYADRAKCLVTVAVVNEDESSKKIRELTEEIERLKALLDQNSANPTLTPRFKGASHENLAIQLVESEKLRQLEAKTWQEKEEQAREIALLRETLSSQQGIANRLSKARPSFININEDPHMSECLFYTLKEDVTTIGCDVSDNNRDILLCGEGIKGSHALVKVSHPGCGGNVQYETIIVPWEDAEVRINGFAISEPTVLAHNDRIIFGVSHVFRYSDPKSACAKRASIVDYHKVLEEKFAAEREEMLKKAASGEILKLRVGSNDDETSDPSSSGDFFVVKAEVQAEQANRLKNMEEKMKLMEQESKENVSRQIMSETSVANSKAALLNAPAASKGSSLVSAAQLSNIRVARAPNLQIFRHKIVLVGHQEVGKTSLRKCFEGDPIFSFFAKLPEVRSTTGVEAQQRSIMVNGDSVELMITDCAGQEAYHSHTLFLTSRSVFVLVWKISAIEQDFRSSGISEHEEERLCQWIAEVYSKFPSAKVLLMATHLDEMRDQSERGVGFILNKVEELLSKYARKIARKDDEGNLMMLQIVGNFAVSCKRRVFMTGGPHSHCGGKKLDILVRLMGDISHNECLNDSCFPAAAFPGRHIRFMNELRKAPCSQMLVSLGEYVNLAVKVGIQSDEELLQISQLLHSWNVIFLFNQQKLNSPENVFVFLKPVWLCKMAGTLFSFAHVISTPVHLRSLIGGLDYNITQAEAADMSLMCKGYLRFPLARILFYRSLVEVLKREPEDTDYYMCIQLLRALELVCMMSYQTDDPVILEEESIPIEAPAGTIHRYFVPSLSPFTTPVALKSFAQILFHRGLHICHQFNMIPNEMWYKLLYRLNCFTQFISVPCPIGSDDIGLYRLQEADDVHNLWSDGMWLSSPCCRVLLIREGTDSIRLYSAETDKEQAEESLHCKVEEQISGLLTEYVGVERTVLVQCPVPTCKAWLKVSEVYSSDTVHCAGCDSEISSSSVVSSGISDMGPKQFDPITVNGMCEMLQASLDPVVQRRMYEFIDCPSCEGIYNSISEDKFDEDADQTPSENSKVLDMFKSLDNIVRHQILMEHWERNRQPAQ